MSGPTQLSADKVAERAVIAALLTSPDAFDDIIERLNGDDFADSRLGAILHAAVTCESSGRPTDVVTVSDALRVAGDFDRVGGTDALNKLAAMAGQVDNLAAHIDIVADHSKLRRVVTAGRSMVAAGSAKDADADEVLSEAERLVFELGADKDASSLVTIGQAMPGYLAELAQNKGRDMLGGSTGFRDLDRIMSGLQPGQLIVLAARPGMGKSALALQLARNFTQATNQASAVLSYEMSRSELLTRVLSQSIAWPSSQIQQGNIPEGLDLELAREAELLSSLPIAIDDSPPETIGALRSSMRRWARREPLGLIVVDYLQLLTSDRRNTSNRTEEVSEISRGLKRLADELGCAVIALSQLSRNVEQRANKRPVLSDLRESGSIEQDANCVLFLYRDHYYNPAAEEREAELIVAKQRSGQSGVTIYLGWDGPCTKFADSDKAPSAGVAVAGAPAPPMGGGRPF